MTQQYVEQLERAIEEHLDNIEILQAKLALEEKTLQQCLKELRIYETNLEISTYNAYAGIA
jgi:flagellar biosynthesis chaperone FliJ